MTSKTLTEILQYVRNFVKRNRPAYKDYLGEETVTKTNLIAEGTLIDYSEDQGLLNLKDPSFTGFVKGESYDVTIGENTYQILPQIAEGTLYLSNADYVNDIAPKLGTDEEPPEFWLILYMSPDGENNYVVTLSHGSFAGKSISISQTKTTVEKKYDIKKLSEELLPNNIAKKSEVAAIKKLANDAKSVGVEALDEAYVAQTTATNAQTTATNAQTTATNAQTTATNAQTTANKSVQFEAQSLTAAEKQVARTNIGAGTDNYNDLKNKPLYLTEIKIITINPSSLIKSSSIYYYRSNSNAATVLDSAKTYVLNNFAKYPVKSLTINISTGDAATVYYIGNSFLIKEINSASWQKVLGTTSSITLIEFPDEEENDSFFFMPGGCDGSKGSIINTGNYTFISNTNDWDDITFYKLESVHLLESIFLPIDNTTIKINNKGQLTLALSNANGVSF